MLLFAIQLAWCCRAGWKFRGFLSVSCSRRMRSAFVSPHPQTHLSSVVATEQIHLTGLSLYILVWMLFQSLCRVMDVLWLKNNLSGCFVCSQLAWNIVIWTPLHVFKPIRFTNQDQSSESRTLAVNLNLHTSVRTKMNSLLCVARTAEASRGRLDSVFLVSSVMKRSLQSAWAGGILTLNESKTRGHKQKLQIPPASNSHNSVFPCFYHRSIDRSMFLGLHYCHTHIYAIIT